MKHSLAFILFLWAAISGVNAQHSDTTKVVSPVLPLWEDSIRVQSKSSDIAPAIPDVKEYYDFKPFDYPDNQTAFKWQKSSGKNIFNASYSKFIIPGALISYGIVARGNDELRSLDRSTRNEVTEHFTARIHLDDYTQFAPAVAVYGLDMLGIKAKHNFRDRTFVMAASHIIMLSTVYSIKITTQVERPDGSNKHSFPSGHTAEAFVGAHVLFKEYKDISPWIGVGGYVVAAGTGAMRVINNKHWVSDVVTGAGIGILSVELGYLLLPVFHNMFGIKNKKSSFVVAPAIGKGSYGAGLAYTF